MNKKLLIHMGILLVMILITIGSWSRANATAEQAKKDAEEAYMNDDYAETHYKDDHTGDVMIATAIPFMITVLYAGVLGVIYFLPAAVEKVSEEVYGSTEEIDEDGMHDARAAFAKGEFTEAIRLYRKVWEQDKANRFPIVEVAKIQHDNLESPSLAVDTLREALESNDWRENDAAFFMFRIADIYENDLEQHEGAIKILQQVIEELPGSRHAANATHKLRELGAI
ncbi:tetratricopeptide repeat protein [Akkermansiaceae bacterium]|nr:tetratricopeptide repeat protein [Akkermansiaceae bacterium]